MRANSFWLNDGQWTEIKPPIPLNLPGRKPRNDARHLAASATTTVLEWARASRLRSH
jgi:hypothetical protein